MKFRFSRFSFSHVSIKQKLPLFICVLLLFTVVIFGYTAYFGMKESALATGRERLKTLTTQLSGMFQQFGNAIIARYHDATNQEPVKRFLSSDGKESRADALNELHKLNADSSVVTTELFNSKGEKLLSEDSVINISVAGTFSSAHSLSVGFAEIGKIYVSRNSMYYPVVVAVTEEKQFLGYAVIWRKLITTAQANEQFSKLIGAGGSLYIGNNDFKFWTNGITPVSNPPATEKNIGNAIEYTGADGNSVIGEVQPIGGTSWLLLITLSEDMLLETVRHFLYTLIIIGAVIVFAGILIARVMSRRITQPLHKLADAASEIAAGNYSLHVDVTRKDELGKLADAFNAMAVQVYNAHHDLEKKVQLRTAELEMANKELEAFSYSVSHDLQTPLRIIDGYASMLSKKHSDNLDDDGVKLIDSIKTKVSRMGKLIDQLLNLARLGKKELTVTFTDMNEVVRSVMKEQLAVTVNNVEIKMQQIEDAFCDGLLIRQVWSNIISNAIKYSMNCEYPCVEIDSYKKEDEIIYSIKDNGVGFDMKYAGKLFNVFERLHSKEFEGTGIGLALVQRIITKHGGTVWAESETNKGAVFYFSLPIKND
jgi:signal transduction histidine kinase